MLGGMEPKNQREKAWPDEIPRSRRPKVEVNVSVPLSPEAKRVVTQVGGGK